MPALALAAPAGLAVALTAGPPAAAQQKKPEAVSEGRFASAAIDRRADEWRAAARMHVGGEFDDPAIRVAHWPTDLTKVVVDRVIRQRRTERKDPAGAAEDRRVLAKGLVLHTDIAVAERSGKAGTAAGGRSYYLVDATPVASMRLSLHWALGRRLAEALAAEPAGAPIARAWYRAAGALYQQWGDLGQLRAHLVAVDGRFADDPVLLLFAGTLHQGYADPRLQFHVRPAPDGRSLDRFVLPDQFVQSQPIEDSVKELAMAERALRRALAIDPAFVEARIRLAHVLDARGQPVAARTLAREALAAPLPPFLEYYATMVLGRTEMRLGRRPEARAAFERAAVLYPADQKARVALSGVALADGRDAEGLDTLLRALGPDSPAADDYNDRNHEDDPWAWYFRRHEPDAQSRLLELWRAVP